MAVAPILMAAATGVSLLGANRQAQGQVEAGNAAAAASNYNATVAAENAKVADQNATWAAQAGEAQAGEESQKTRATVGSIKAAQAANGIDVNTGSAVDVRSSAAELGQLSAINIRSNAARTAYGYQTASSSQTAQSQLDTYNAQQERLAGETGASTTILGGVSNAGLNYSKFLQTSSSLNN